MMRRPPWGRPLEPTRGLLTLIDSPVVTAPPCRFSPMMFPSVQTFPVEGVHLNPDTSHKCNKEICSVVLDNLNRRSTGSYRCEISGDAPEFHIVHETANMTVAGEFPWTRRLSLCFGTHTGRFDGPLVMGALQSDELVGEEAV